MIKKLLFKFVKAFKYFSKLGVRSSYEKHFAARIILSNRIMLVCISLTLPYIGVFYGLNQLILVGGIAVVCALYTSVLFFHKNNYHNTAFFLTWLFPVCSIMTYFMVTGTDAGFHFILFFCASLGTILFSREKKSLVIFTMITPIILFFLCEFCGSKYIIVSLFNQNILSILRLSSMVITIVCILSVVSIYINQTIKLLKHRETKETVAKLKLKLLREDIEAKNKLIESSKSNEAFINATTGVAHEIRSPMASLLAGAELLRDNVDDAEAIKEFSELLINTIQRLKVFTQSILSFGGDTSENKTEFDLSLLLKELVALMTYQTKRLGIKILLTQPETCVIHANRNYLAQALLNLIVNATQYTPKKGEISLSVEQQSSHVILRVSDTGAGIPSDQIPFIFTPKTTSKKDTHNTGLGLALVQRVVKDHEGKIDVSSDLNKGTTFTLKLPINA